MKIYTVNTAEHELVVSKAELREIRAGLIARADNLRELNRRGDYGDYRPQIRAVDQMLSAVTRILRGSATSDDSTTTVTGHAWADVACEDCGAAPREACHQDCSSNWK